MNTLISYEKAAEPALAEAAEAAAKAGTDAVHSVTDVTLNMAVKDVHPAGPPRADRVHMARRNSRACRGAARII